MNRADRLTSSMRAARTHDVRADGLVDKFYNLWDRNPVTVKASYLRSHGKVDRPHRNLRATEASP
jgi:hypothetical protein